MQIAQVTATFPPLYSGTGMVCHYYSSELTGLGQKVTVFTQGDQSDVQCFQTPYRVVRFPSLIKFGNAPLLPQLFKLKNYDIIHLHHPFIFGSEILWSRSIIQDIPLILTHHNDLRAKGLRSFLFACYTTLNLHTIIPLARRITVVSLDHTRSGCLSDILARYPERFIQIPNGVDLSQFNLSVDGSSIRHALHLDLKSFLVLFVGEMDPAHHYRRVDNLIRAVKLVSDPLVHLLLIGGGGNVPTYQMLTEQLGLVDQVHFLGRIDHQDLPKYYAGADLFVLPSCIQEAFPLVVLEAMACGLPVVVSDLPGVRTLVTKEVGFTVKPGDVEELAERILRIRDKPEESKQMGERGHAIVSQTYSWTVIGKQLIDLYQLIIH